MAHEGEGEPNLACAHEPSEQMHERGEALEFSGVSARMKSAFRLNRFGFLLGPNDVSARPQRVQPILEMPAVAVDSVRVTWQNAMADTDGYALRIFLLAPPGRWQVTPDLRDPVAPTWPWPGALLP